MSDSYQPISCSLPTVDAARQSLEWLDLRRHAIRTERLDDGIAMTFGVDLADSIEDLADREASCCGFLSIITTRTESEIRLAVTSQDPDVLPVIELLAGPRE